MKKIFGAIAIFGVLVGSDAALGQHSAANFNFRCSKVHTPSGELAISISPSQPTASAMAGHHQNFSVWINGRTISCAPSGCALPQSTVILNRVFDVAQIQVWSENNTSSRQLVYEAPLPRICGSDIIAEVRKYPGEQTHGVPVSGNRSRPRSGVVAPQYQGVGRRQ